MASQNTHVAQGDDLKPHDSNPNSVQEDVAAAMKVEIDKVEDLPEALPASEPGPPPGDAEPPLEPVEGLPAAAPAGDPAPGDLDPPAAWSAADQDIFRGVDKPTQEFLLARDAAAAQPYQTQLEALQPYQQIQTQWDPYFKQLGVPPAQALNQVLQTEMVLRTGTPAQKQQAAVALLQQYGIEIGQPQAPALPDELADNPFGQAVNARLQEITTGLETLRAEQATKFGQFEQSRAQTQQSALADFRDAKGADGKPLHPHYGEVEALMDSLAQNAIATGQRTTLQTVYEQACWASPEVRAKLQAAERAGGLADRQTSAAAKQRASKSVSGSPAGSRTVEMKEDPNQSVHDTVKAAYAAHSGAGTA